MKMLIAVALGGAVGATGRYLFATQTLRYFGPGFPWGTLGVNIIGSFLMGVIVESLALRFQVSPEVRAFLVTGVLGGFTTFSAFSLDISLLLERKDVGVAAFYAFGSLGGAVLALFFGIWLTRVVLS
ncbi:MAG: fluoride efflux transporter CrcB [Parvibaculaceae bacterium]|nr:putative fluoride ion transporter CrcB [Rhodobiaceae bacterium]MCR9241196.1 fluoride efflux transporter CrcB [Rhodobiaceae bacterium]MDF1846593.1 fluoride efflux transporter CrcB [Parvibaculaceae bacterium]HBM88490.1 fluoride efflux transporter CrcB [Rhodobiaceae bacterium]